MAASSASGIKTIFDAEGFRSNWKDGQAFSGFDERDDSGGYCRAGTNPGRKPGLRAECDAALNNERNDLDIMQRRPGCERAVDQGARRWLGYFEASEDVREKFRRSESTAKNFKSGG